MQKKALTDFAGNSWHQRSLARGWSHSNADELYAEAINQAMIERLRRIDAAGGETDTGVIIVTFHGYISGVPSLFSSDFNTALVFENKEPAEAFRRTNRSQK